MEMEIKDSMLQCFIDLSNVDLEPIKFSTLIKKTDTAVDDSQTIPVTTVTNTPAIPVSAISVIPVTTAYNKLSSVFADIAGCLQYYLTDESTTHKLDINGDFLTGYYLNKNLHLNNFKKNVVYCLGISSDGFVQGYYYSLMQKSKLELYGTDKKYVKKYAPIYVNGVKANCNVYNLEHCSKINSQLYSRIKPRELTLFIGDIKATNYIHVMYQFLYAIGWISESGTIVLRIPTNWETCKGMSYIMYYFISLFNHVKVFKTPWYAVPDGGFTLDANKTYLILREPKQQLNHLHYTGIYSFLSDVANSNLDSTLANSNLDSTLYNSNLDSTLASELSNLHNELIKFLNTTLDFSPNKEDLINSFIF